MIEHLTPKAHEAIDTLAEELRRLKAKYDADTVFIITVNGQVAEKFVNGKDKMPRANGQSDTSSHIIKAPPGQESTKM
jgi:predicted molibdopterin-dependent oxidoreductase YjgC